MLNNLPFDFPSNLKSVQGIFTVVNFSREACKSTLVCEPPCIEPVSLA